MAPKFQRKEDFSKKAQAWVEAASKTWNVPEAELWQEIFEDAKNMDELFRESTSPPKETLMSFKVPQ